jgi:hypothetical protein
VFVHQSAADSPGAGTIPATRTSTSTGNRPATVINENTVGNSASLKKTDGDPNGGIGVHRSPRVRQDLATEPASWSRIGLVPAHWNEARI